MRFLFAILLLTASLDGADLIDSSRLVDWENATAGVEGGIPDSSTMTVDALITPTGANQTAAFNSAIGSCPSNQVVQLTNGTYILNTGINWQSADGVVLRGIGDSTILQLNGGKIYMRGTYDDPTGLAGQNCTANVTKGATTLTVASVPSWLLETHWYIIDQLDDSDLNDNDTDEGGSPFRNGRGLGHPIRVTDITGTTITFWPPSPYTFETANDAEIAKVNYDPESTTPLQRCGIENLKIVGNFNGGNTDHSVFMEGARNCWMKNVTSTNVPGGIHVMLYGAMNCEVRHCFFSHSVGGYGGGEGYGVACYYAAGQNLIVDNIFNNLHVSMQCNYGSTYNVFIYNYERNGFGTSGQDPALNFHGNIAIANLMEGNWCEDKFLSDDTHGSGGAYNTIFRNRIEGDGDQSFDPSCINISGYNRHNNVVGNLLGDSDHDTYMIHYPTSGGDDWDNSVIHLLGYGVDPNFDNAATLDTYIAVNWDHVTSTNSGIVLGGKTTSDLAAVSSYYYTSEPSNFGILRWPPYGPDVGTGAEYLSHTNIPAGYRYTFGEDPPEDEGGEPPTAVENFRVIGNVRLQGNVSQQ